MINWLYFLAGLIVGAIFAAAVFRKSKSDDALIKSLKEQLNQMQRDNATLLSNLGAARERVKTLEDVRGKMLTEFKNISTEVLAQTREAANAQQTEKLNTTITPFREQIEKLTADFNTQIKEMLVHSAKNKTSLEEQMKTMMESSSALKKEASDLTEALRGNKKIQGNWGEMQIERLFEILGWQDGVQYESQKHLSDGRDIPDFIVHMPGDKHFVVDAKVSLNSYMDYTATDDAAQKRKYWHDFVDATKKHILELKDKNYSRVVDKKFDFVCMFMPLEHAFTELMNREDSIYKFAYDNGVTIATPSLLMPMLRTIDMLVRAEKQNKNVAQIVEYAEKLYEKYAGFTEDYARIGAALDAAQKRYDDGRKKLQTGSGNMSGWFEKIKKQGGLTVSKQLALPPQDGDETNE